MAIHAATGDKVIHKYAAAISALHLEGGHSESATYALPIRANDKEEAAKIAMDDAKITLPVKDGWYSHKVSIAEFADN